jgi:hypothetical protein
VNVNNNNNKKGTVILDGLADPHTVPIPNSIFHPEATEIRHVVNTLQDIIGIPQSLTISKGAKPRRCTPETTTTMSTPLYIDGTIVQKKFQVNGAMIPYEGEIKSYDPINKWYHIVYKDGDTEDFTATTVKHHRKQNQQYSRAPRVEPLDLIGGLPQSIPTISNQSNKVNKALSTQLHTALLATKTITDNNPAEGIIKGTIKQKRSISIDMRFYWLKDRKTWIQVPTTNE